MKNLLVCIFSISVVLPVFAEAWYINSVEVDAGLVWIGNAQLDGEAVGAPGPVIGLVRITSPVYTGKALTLYPALSLFGLNYAFQEEDRPKPAQIEHREMYVFATVLDLMIGKEFRTREKISYVLKGGPSFFLRIPVSAAPGEPDRTTEMNSYFYEDVRFFFLSGGGQVEYKFSERFYFGLNMTMRLPVFHLWDGESGALYDQMMLEGALGVRCLF